MNTLPERIATKIIPEPNSGCWLWTASLTTTGYGAIRWGKTMKKAHRVIYELIKSELPSRYPSGLVLDHLCRVRSCVNPDHLEIVTQKENCQRGNAKFNGQHQRAQTHCIHGHEFDEQNTIVRRGKHGRRSCRQCKNISKKKYRQKLKARKQQETKQ